MLRIVDASKVYRLLYPAVPVVVATAYRSSSGGGGAKGETTVTISAMPVASLVSLSNSPPLVGFSSSSSHATFSGILEAKAFSVSWLDRKYAKSVEYLGASSGRDVSDKLITAGLHYEEERGISGTAFFPKIVEASAYLFCALDRVDSYGDHELVVGHVAEARAEEDFDEYWSFKNYNPILYTGLGRGFAAPPVSLSHDSD